MPLCFSWSHVRSMDGAGGLSVLLLGLALDAVRDIDPPRGPRCLSGPCTRCRSWRVPRVAPVVVRGPTICPIRTAILVRPDHRPHRVALGRDEPPLLRRTHDLRDRPPRRLVDRWNASPARDGMARFRLSRHPAADPTLEVSRVAMPSACPPSTSLQGGIRAVAFMQAMGHPFAFPSPEQRADALADAESMPNWPDQDAVMLRDGVAIVRFAAPTAP